MGKKKVIEVTDPPTGNPVPVTLETIHVGEKSFTVYRHGCVFVQYPPPDKRKMTEVQVKRYTAEREAALAMVEAYKHPTPDLEVVRRHALAPSERRSPFEWGTLDWYRNAPLAQDQIRLLESERDMLLSENADMRGIIERLLDENEMRKDDGQKGGRSSSVPKDWQKTWEEIRTRHPVWLMKQVDIETSQILKCSYSAIRMKRQRGVRKH